MKGIVIFPTFFFNTTTVINEEALIDDVFTDGSFVFEDYGKVVFVKAEAVDSPAVGGCVFGGKKPDTEEGFHVFFDEGLKAFFDVGLAGDEFFDGGGGLVEGNL